MNQPQLTEIEASVDRKTKSRHFKLNNKHQSIKGTGRLYKEK